MKPADDPNVDYKALVERGYDTCAARYEEARQLESHPELGLLTSRLPRGAHVLDIGCGAGVPVARALADSCRVTGVDISGEQIRRARQNVPTETFIRGDIMSMAFPAAGFDAVVAFYSIFHVPREDHAVLLRRVGDWLKPGGYLLMTVTANAEAAYTEDNFFGVSMYWSNFGLEDYTAALADIGFTVLETTVIGHGYSAESQAPAEHHPLVFAQSAHYGPLERR